MTNSFTKAIVCVAVLAAVGGFAQGATIGHWQFNEKSPGEQTTGVAGEILDSSGNGYHGYAVGNPLPSYVAGHYDLPSAIALTRGSIDQDPNEDRIVIPHDDAFNFDLSLGAGESFTIEAFIKGTDPTGAFVTKRASTGPGYGIRLFNGVVKCYLQGQTPPTHHTWPDASGTIRVDDGEWHHIAVVIDADAADPLNNEVRFYVDWVHDVTVLLTSVSYPKGVAIGADLSNDHDIWIGDFREQMSCQFVGDIDAVRISSGALTPSEFLPVPEPSSVVLLVGLCGVGLVLLRRRQR